MKRKFLCVAVMIIYTLQIICFAEINFERDAAMNRYKVSGTADFATDYTVSCFVGDDDVTVYLKTNITDESFGYEFDFGLRDDVQTDEYALKISAAGTEEAFSMPVKLYSNSDVERAITRVVAENEKAELMDILEEEYYVLGLDYLRKFNISAASDSLLAEKLLGNVTDRNEFYDLYTKNYIVYAVDDASPEKIGEILETYEEHFQLSKHEVYPVFSSINDKNKVYNIMSGYSYTDIASVNKAFSEAALLRAMAETVYYGKIMEVLEQYEEYFPFSLEDYKKSRNKIGAAKALVGKDKVFQNMNSFKVALDEALSDTDSNSGGGASGGGGSAGGGFSSSGQSTVVAEVFGKDNSKQFRDMQGFDWAGKAVEYLKEAGVINGYEDNTFKPANKVTREEFVKIIISAFGYYDEDAICSFRDVDNNSWAYKYIASAYQSGIVKGISETEFGFGNYLSRQDMAVIIYNAMKFNPADDEKFDDDEQISDYAKEAVCSLKKNGIINGYNNQYMPKEYATRAEVAKIVYECLNKGGR